MAKVPMVHMCSQRPYALQLIAKDSMVYNLPMWPQLSSLFVRHRLIRVARQWQAVVFLWWMFQTKRLATQQHLHV